MTTTYPQLEATSENQSVELAKLNDILTQIQTTAANQATEIARLTSILAAFSTLATSLKQDTQTATLSNILDALSYIETDASSILKRMTSDTLSRTDPVEVKGVSVELLPYNGDRKGFYLFNTGVTTLYVNLGADAGTSDYIQSIPANTGWGMTGPALVWLGSVTGIRASGLANVNIYEFT